MAMNGMVRRNGASYGRWGEVRSRLVRCVVDWHGRQGQVRRGKVRSSEVGSGKADMDERG